MINKYIEELKLCINNFDINKIKEVVDFIMTKYESNNQIFIIGNGGTIDILAHRVKRAPEVYQKLGLEWFYRLSKDPRRIKRQMVIPVFILTILFSREETVE